MNTVVLQALRANHAVATADAVADQEVQQLLRKSLGIVINDGERRLRVLLLLLLHLHLLGTVRRRSVGRLDALDQLLLLLTAIIVRRACAGELLGAGLLCGDGRRLEWARFGRCFWAAGRQEVACQWGTWREGGI